MHATAVFPDLVVGASVGSLMGRALAAISIAPEDQENRLLEELAGVFLKVDKEVALTRTLKNAAKQLGVRARDVEISPAELRSKVLKGSQADPGFAATGAPSALTDAISGLFMIPHRKTAFIAPEFVAGHVGTAIDQFLKEVRKETLESFEITRALMGISLLEPAARKILGESVVQVRKNEVQPYHHPADKKKKVPFFCTTSFLNARAGLLLGRDFLTEDPSYDFIYAALGSSAFPVVFAPRTEADFVPGRVQTNRLFADGGIFDNLPFFPALEVLGDVQEDAMKDIEEVMKRMKDQLRQGDIFIAAGLEADPDKASDYDTLFKIRGRAGTLATNSKLKTFMGSARRAKKALEDIGASPTVPSLTSDELKFLAQAISPAILKIGPTDKNHINPTFAFCKSVGMDPKTVGLPIADGCFRTLQTFERSHKDPFVQPVFAHTKVKDLEHSPDLDATRAKCPFFSVDGARLDCPFAAAQKDPEVRRIRTICGDDLTHWDA